MARVFPRNIGARPLSVLSVEEYHPGFNEVYFFPANEALTAAKLDANHPEKYKKLILEINAVQNYLTIHPINTLPTHENFLRQKYNKLETITLDGFDYGSAETESDVIDLLEGLPSAFVKDCDYGLGLRADYRFIVNILESLDIKHLEISKTGNTGIDEESATCTIKYVEFEKIRKSIDKISREAKSVSSFVKIISAHNVLAFFLEDDKKYPQKPLDVKDTKLARSIAKSSPVISSKLMKTEQAEAIQLVTKNKDKILKDQPEALIKLRNDIELVTLEQLIQKFDEMLGKKLSEGRWQELFNENPFILNLAFSCPIIKIQDQAYIGGRKISGSGEKIADFLVANGLTKNAALIEIKTPSAPLLNKTAYRDSVYVASSHLAGSINQVLDQRLKFQQNLDSHKVNSKLYNLEAYHVQGILIIGQTPNEPDKQKSFEIFRGNSKDVAIITFNELLEKLKHLQAFLSSDVQEAVK